MSLEIQVPVPSHPLLLVLLILRPTDLFVVHVSEDRSSNVVFFGVPELPLSETKSFIDEVACHLIGRSVLPHWPSEAVS